MLELDHLAVAARTLKEGRAYVEEALGITLQKGGQHPRFGTHNLLIGLADGLYLEVIAVDPQADLPPDPRWFRLDEFDDAPVLHNWVCRTEDMPGDLPQLPEGAGRPISLTRGDLRWKMAVPEDGRLPYDEMCPALIQWEGRHPAVAMTQSGARLQRLLVRHPQALDLAARMDPVLKDARVQFEHSDTPELVAEFDINGSIRTL
ncbi:VOC family protein [Thalassovita sp.]|uniref:VOC family protein n=1 Tax=Thalassovita sp. TaxID=1979401 RepID=UPI0028822521|nr:VOC family protein [Thalassovita sp.]MDF1801814.1 VOC family protein [Thalassovita sp.]